MALQGFGLVAGCVGGEGIKDRRSRGSLSGLISGAGGLESYADGVPRQDFPDIRFAVEAFIGVVPMGFNQRKEEDFES